MSKQKLRYSEGDIFAIPLRTAGYGQGLVARVGRGGKVVFGYFFGPARKDPADLKDLEGARPKDAVLLARFGDLSLQAGDWPLVGRYLGYSREAWPMPPFGRVDVVSGTRAWITEYADDDPRTIVREVECAPAQVTHLPRDATLGAGVVELALTGLLGHPAE